MQPNALQSFLSDIRFSIRTLARTPAFTATVVAALALGIGANTAVFSVIDTVLLKPLAFPDPDRMVLFFVTTPAGPVYGSSATKFNILRGADFDDVSAYEYGGANLNLGSGPTARQIHAIRVSAGYFRLFGAPVLEGRAFTPEEDRPGGGHVAVVSYGLWLSRFGGDRQLLGKTILLSGIPYQVVGILGSGFNTELDTPPDVWLPFQIDPRSTDHAQYFNVVARLKPGASVPAANAKLQRAAEEFRRRFPNIMGSRDGFAVEPFQDSMVSDARPSLLILAGAVSFVLLIACANVANLLLVRATGRKREIAIRAAIGAGRSRIVRQLLTESAVLSAIGGAFGIVLGLAGVRVLVAMIPGDLPRVGENGAAIALDWRVVAFTAAISLVTAILFGLVPALESSRADLAGSLKDGGARTGTGLDQHRTRSLLVVSEMALALVLLIGAALLIRTFVVLRAVDPGFNPHHVLTLRMSLAGTRFQNAAAVEQLVRDGVMRLNGLPGVLGSAASYTLPLEGGFGVPFNIGGRTPADGRYDGRGYIPVSPSYFEVFRIPVLRGRAFNDRDGHGSAGVAIINQAMVRRFWTGGDPLGDRIILGKGYGPEFEEPARQIVGIVNDVHDFGLNRNPQPVVYVPMAQVTDGITALVARAGSLVWIVRTRPEPYSLRTAMAGQLSQASAGLPVAHVRSMNEIVGESTTRADFNMTLLSIFGGSALLLAVIGIYGLMAYSVEQRKQEIGIRLALGADGGRVQRLVVWEGMRLALAGVGVGIAAAFGLTRLLAGFLFGVQAWDPLVFIAAPIVLSAAALCAVWLPARRAAGIDALQALREG